MLSYKNKYQWHIQEGCLVDMTPPLSRIIYYIIISYYILYYNTKNIHYYIYNKIGT